MRRTHLCRVQWVAPADRMAGIIDRLTRAGARLVARSSYDMATSDLDLIEDLDTGYLGIAEFAVESFALLREVVAATKKLGPCETMLIDLTGARAKTQILPVPGDQDVIVRHQDGLRRFPRSDFGFQHAPSVVSQLASGGQISC